LLFDKNDKPLYTKDTVFIFYCEFSQKRGPKMYRYLRKLDRQINLCSYPNLFYPNIYVLEGGYKRFYNYFLQNQGMKNVFKNLTYIPMLEPKFIDILQVSLKNMKESWERKDQDFLKKYQFSFSSGNKKKNNYKKFKSCSEINMNMNFNNGISKVKKIKKKRDSITTLNISFDVYKNL
jgi:hypothetical protein